MITFEKIVVFNAFQMAPYEQTIPLLGLGVVNVLGRNLDDGGSCGAGKSTAACDLLTTALFCENNKDSKKDEIINELFLDLGCYIIVHFNVDHRKFQTIYSRKHKEYGTDHYLYEIIDGKAIDIRGEKLLDTKDMISKILGLSYNQFVAITMLQQGKATLFIEGDNKTKIDIISSMIDVDYTKHEKKAKEKKEELVKEIDDLKSKNEAYKSQEQDESVLLLVPEIENQTYLSINNINKKISTKKKNLEKTQNKIQTKEIELNKFISKKDLLKNKYEGIEDKIESIEKELELILQNKNTEIKNIEKEINEIKNNKKTVDGCITEVASQKQKLIIIEKEYKTQNGIYTKKIKDAIEQKTEYENKKTKLLELKTKLLKKDQLLKKQDECLTKSNTLKNSKKELKDKKAIHGKSTEVLAELKKLEKSKTKLEIDIENLETDIASLKKNKESFCAKCFQSVTEDHKEKTIHDKLVEVKGQQTNLDKLNKEIETLQGLLPKENVENRIAKLEAIIEECEEFLNKNENLEKDIEECNKDLENYTDFIIDNKPIELSILNIDVESMRSELDDLTENYNEEKNSLDKSISSLESKIKSLKTKSEYSQKDIDSINEKISEQKESSEAKIKDQESLLDEIEKEVESINVSTASYKSEVEVLEKEKDSIDQEISEEEKRLEESKSLIDRNEERKSRILELQKKILENNESISELDRKRKICDFWVVSFGDKGIKSFKFGAIIGEINKSLVTASHKLNEGKILVQFSNKKETKTAGVKREVSMVVRDSFKSRLKPKAYSGGEKQLISLMVIVSLWEVTSVILGKSTNLLVLDEIYASLDQQRSSQTTSLIESIDSKKRSVLVITHTKDEFACSHQLICTKKDGQIKVEMLSV